MGESGDARPIVVQESFPVPRATTNPYIAMLRDALDADDRLVLQTFSWRAALLSRYDVFHAHWPEILVTGRDRLRSVARQVLFAALLLRLRLRRTPVVRTVHNLEVPSGLGAVQRALLRRFDRGVRVRIALNEETRLDPERSVTVLHGHYRDWFSRYPRPEAIAGRYGYFGLIRRYKNVEGLVRAFRPLPDDRTLEVAGAPSTPELQRAITDAADGDPRILLRFEYLSDAELVESCGRAELVVLPYLHMHNSGGALAALSLDRPVLVPRNPANDRLAVEAGEAWVQRYDGPLTAEALSAALSAVRAIAPGDRPDLGARSWGAAADGHVRAFRLALSSAQSRRYSR
ncbi:glycosyltransferase family protein [Amnibacterium setariae]|uniref:Glycosyl transferase n=1 Tax=Amnibacterium setariae TaxID=2306585 RepID=A0A3A1U1Y7_9MICO|nr:glycosyl transferase [Amnibacterium setariae]RIX26617.1 glycosyl transferase [Amnibacterium setariae]